MLRLASDELMRTVGIRDNITIRVNSKDQQTIEMLKAELPKTVGRSEKSSAWKSPIKSQGGGCTIETQWSAIDASIETQLKGIYEALIGTGSRECQTVS